MEFIYTFYVASFMIRYELPSNMTNKRRTVNIPNTKLIFFSSTYFYLYIYTQRQPVSMLITLSMDDGSVVPSKIPSVV